MSEKPCCARAARLGGDNHDSTCKKATDPRREKEVVTMPARDWTVAVNEFFNVEFLIDGKVELVMSSEEARGIAEAFTQAANVADGTHQ